MSDFFDNLGKAVNETAKKAIKASGNVVELTKTSLNIKFDEVKRESFFKEIGKIVYNDYKDSPDGVKDEILDFCKCIDEVEISIGTQKAKAAGIKNKKFCVDCGVILCKTVNYCYSCGAKQPEIPIESCDCGCGCEDDQSCDCGCEDGQPCDCGCEDGQPCDCGCEDGQPCDCGCEEKREE